jgi:hypothetical protein
MLDRLEPWAVCLVLRAPDASEELQTVCVQRELVTFDTIPETARGLFEGRCAMFAFDVAALLALKNCAPDTWKNCDCIDSIAKNPLPWELR